MVAGPCPSTLFWTKYPMHAGQYSTTDQAAFFSSAFVYLKKNYIYILHVRKHEETKQKLLSSLIPALPFDLSLCSFLVDGLYTSLKDSASYSCKV